MMKRLYAAAAAAAVLAGCHGASSGGDGSPRVAKVGEAAPSWHEMTTSGTSIAMASLRGKPVYLNFFASWCPPCNAEAPDINALQRKYADRGLQVVGVDVLDSATKATAFVAQHHLDYPAVVDGGTLRDAYNINGLPVHVFIDRQGIVRKIAVGELSRAQMEAGVKAIL